MYSYNQVLKKAQITFHCSHHDTIESILNKYFKNKKVMSVSKDDMINLFSYISVEILSITMLI